MNKLLACLIAFCLLISPITYGEVFVDGKPPAPSLLTAPLDVNNQYLSNVFSIVFSDGTSMGTVVDAMTKGELASTTPGDEGIRKVGALGGYTLEGFIEDTATRGLARDLPQFVYSNYPLSNLTVNYSDGDVYDPENGYYKLNAGSHTLTDNSVNYAYWSVDGNPLVVKWTTGIRPTAENSIYLGTFVTAFGAIIRADTSIATGDALLYEDVAFANVMPSLIVEGLTVFATGTNLTNIVVSGGTEYHDLADRIVHNTQAITNNNFLVFTHSNTLWSYVQTNKFPIGLWDNGTNLVNCDTSKWYRGVFVSIANSGFISYVAPDYEYTNEATALAGSDPDVPPSFTPYIPLTYAYVFSGNDISLRTDSTYWLDRRFMIRRGTLTTGGSSGGGNTPTLQQVLSAGNGTGGILPTGMGLPTTPDQAASKEYVDSTRNKSSTGTAYVDPTNGNDLTGEIEKASLPFKTIQAAIDACAAVASDSRRFLVTISIGVYHEDVIMHPFISVRGMDVEATIIEGQVSFNPDYEDSIGTELQVLTVRKTNDAAIVINTRTDNSYAGFRSCAFYSVNTIDKPIREVVRISRGNAEFYGTCWFQNDISDITAKRATTIYYLTTDPTNAGTYVVNLFCASHILNIEDTNDTISITYCNSTNGGFFASKNDATILHMDGQTNHENRVTSVVHKNAKDARTFEESSIINVQLNIQNNCDVIGVSSTGSTGSAVAHFNNSRMLVPYIKDDNLFYGSSATTSDAVEIINSQIGVSASAYPQRYTNAGSAGTISYTLQHGLGDLLIGGGLDVSASIGLRPKPGHIKLFASTYAGLENPNWMDSSGNVIRGNRDLFYNGFNDTLTSLNVGEAVYISSGLSADGTPKVKRSNAMNPETMPSIGVVAQYGGIATGAVGRIMIMGRLESTFDSTAFTAGQKLYVGTVDGLITNVAPTNSGAIVQQMSTANRSATNGYMNVRPWHPDWLGGLPPSAYVTYTSPIFSSTAFILTNSAAAKFSIDDIPANTTNTYILPSQGGVLATYTDIQLVPVSAIVGELDGIQKGRVVYQSGVTNNKPIVKYADRRDSSTLPVIGVTLDTVGYGQSIEVANFGPVIDTDTSLFNTNEFMYLGMTGRLDRISGYTPDAIIIMGTCLKSDASVGSMLVNMRPYYMDGSFSGSLRYTIKNASSATNAAAALFVVNDMGDAARLVIRGSNNGRGKASILTSSTDGPFYMANAKRRPIIWNIDMSNAGDEFSHLRYPMMALVPQINTTNAFLGIGTTNPITMLHIAGSASVSNGYRLSSNGYTDNELVTYGTSTNLITITSNAFVSADTSLSNNLVLVINGKDTIISNAFIAADTTCSNNLVLVINGKDTIISNAFVSADTTLSNNLVLVINGKDTIISNAFVSADTIVSNAFVNADTVLQGQINTTTNRVQQLENQTNLWNTASEPTHKFFANIGGGVQTFGNGTTDKVNYTNSVSNVGGIYSNRVARWIPGVSNVYVRINGNVNVDMGNNSIAYIYIYKNGAQKTIAFSKRTTNAGEELYNCYSFSDITTNVNDYYEVYLNIAGGGATLNGNNGNWWSGQVVY